MIAKPPEFYGRKSLKPLAARVPKVTEPRVDGAGTTRPVVGPGRSARCTSCSLRSKAAQPYGIGAYFAYRHDPLTALPDTEAVKHAMDKLKLLVSIDVRYSETGWYSDVILPESTYLERANILAGMPGPVPVFLMRDQAVAPRFDSRPAWWIFREILRRMGVKEALDFETIEETLELPARRHRHHGGRDARSRASCRWPTAPKLTPRDALKFPTPSGKIEIDSAIAQAGRAAKPCRRTKPKQRRPAIALRCCSGGRRRSRTASR